MPSAWYYLDGPSARRFRPGQIVAEGELLGLHASTPIRALDTGRVAAIEYDIWRDEVIVAVEPAALQQEAA